ncbi:hypothetical protein, partial [Burkholderia vietnamiensis]|uniref:hypothetical protein n=1 Tax=Burkholderia vietnamiensis TaxID=60552 RepID=UPI001CF40C6B
NMPTVITSVSPAQRLSRAFNHVGQNSMKTTALGGSVLRGHQQRGRLGITGKVELDHVVFSLTDSEAYPRSKFVCAMAKHSVPYD